MGPLLPSPLTPAESEYYSRQLRTPDWGLEGQERLRRSSVLVVGAGGLGCPALLYLTGAGVGRLGIADPDKVALSNLPRQVLFQPGHVGRGKADTAAEILRDRNPWIQVEAIGERVDRHNVRDLVEAFDLVLDGTDNFQTKFLLHDACLAAGKPLVMGSLYQWEAQIQVFPFHRSREVCLRCLYPVAPEDGCVGTCEQVGVAGALAGSVGGLQALSAIQMLLGLPGLAAGETLVLDFRDWSTRKLRWKARPDCLSCGGSATWDFLQDEPEDLERDWSTLTPEDRGVIVDLRENREVGPRDWDLFFQAGAQVIHHPLSEWGERPPSWEGGRTYLLVCAHGIRSLGAARSLTAQGQGRFLSLRGGLAGLAPTSVD